MIARFLLVAVLGLLVGCSSLPGGTDTAAGGVDTTAPETPTGAGDEVFDPDNPGGAPEPVSTEAAVEPVPEPVLEPEPAVKAPEPDDANAAARIKCVSGNGIYAKSAAGGFICVNRTSDATKSCTASSQCEGSCLARSGTCSPVVPLIGCNEILTDRGNISTVCID